MGASPSASSNADLSDLEFPFSAPSSAASTSAEPERTSSASTASAFISLADVYDAVAVARQLTAGLNHARARRPGAMDSDSATLSTGGEGAETIGEHVQADSHSLDGVATGISNSLHSRIPMYSPLSHPIPQILGSPDETANVVCAICTNVAYYPMMTACQHVFCAICLGQWIVKRSSCPLCRRDVSFASLQRPTSTTHPEWHRQYMALQVRCPLCGWEGLMGAWTLHQVYLCWRLPSSSPRMSRWAECVRL